jgi:hypothetical protein
MQLCSYGESEKARTLIKELPLEVQKCMTNLDAEKRNKNALRGCK